MTSKLNINWLNKCRCGNRMHTVETVRGSHVRLFEDDAVKCNACGREGVIQTCDAIATVLVGMDQPAPVVPDGYVMVPMRLTAENGAKGALSGEFSETKFVNCPECFGDEECETCDGSGKIEITVPVTWTTIKAIWVKGVEHFAATAQEND
ncbi:hypothetical protein [Klebsiella pneumoniae]|uniref:hypothetical protein n=1 Tax=Klebsiella pneumoniae TaxID=573 RepID=UPI001D112331|nr:hypothetical protein [Klebsiella pneumoniae]